MIEINPNGIYTLKELSEKLEKNERTIRKEITEGRLKANTAIKPYQITGRAVLNWLENSNQEGNK